MKTKDSLDRFGDDLLEVLLSYLPLEDRYRCEYVSKQWQRLIYETLYSITIDDKLIEKMMETNIFGREYCESYKLIQIMRKCVNIETIHCRGFADNKNVIHMFEAIQGLADNCLLPKRFHYKFTQTDASYDHMRPLFEMLRTVITGISGNISQCKPYLKYCPKLSQLKAGKLSDVFSGNESVVKNLNKFEFNFRGFVYNHELFAAFVAKNQSLKSLVVTDIAIDSHLNDNEDIVIEFMRQLSDLPELRQLKLHFHQFSKFECLTQIGLKCKKLKYFSLICDLNPVESSVQVLNAIQYITQLRRLKLRLSTKSYNNETLDHHVFDSFIASKCMTHMKLDLWAMNFNLIDTITTNCKKLRRLDVRDPEGLMNRSCMDRMARLPKLQSLAIHSNQGIRLNDRYLNDFVAKSRRLESIEIRIIDSHRYWPQTHGVKKYLKTKNSDNLSSLTCFIE